MERLYLCRRVGDDFEVVGVSPMSQAWKCAVTGAGAYLAWKALRAPGLLGALCAWGGAELLSRGMANKPLSDLVRETFAAGGGGGYGGQDTSGIPDTPSFQHSDRAAATQVPEDIIDEASMESFPASDAPASHHSTALPGEPPTSLAGQRSDD